MSRFCFAPLRCQPFESHILYSFDALLVFWRSTNKDIETTEYRYISDRPYILFTPAKSEVMTMCVSYIYMDMGDGKILGVWSCFYVP